MPNPITDAIVVGAFNPMEGKVISIPTHHSANEKEAHPEHVTQTGKNIETSIQAAPALSDADINEKEEEDRDDKIIITGADAALYLLPLRDDADPSLTFRSLFLASGLSCFQAVMYQIYTVRRWGCPCHITVIEIYTVQTYRNHHFRNLYCPYRLLCW